MNRKAASSFLLVLLSAVPACYGMDGERRDIEEILLQQLQHVRTIKSINMTYEEYWTPSPHSVAAGSVKDWHRERRRLISFEREGEKFRVENLKNESMSNGAKSSKNDYRVVNNILTYDLSKFQTFSKESLTLRVQSKIINPLRRMNHPFFTHYKSFDAGVASRKCRQAFEDPQHWMSLADKASLRGPTTHNGIECKVLEFALPEQGQLVRVHFAIDYDYYPVRTQLMLPPSAIVAQETSTEELARIDTPEGSVVVPVVTKTTWWPNNKESHDRVTITHTIDMERLTINEDIPDERFTIPAEFARVYVDVDDRDSSYNLDTVADDALLRMAESHVPRSQTDRAQRDRPSKGSR